MEDNGKPDLLLSKILHKCLYKSIKISAFPSGEKFMKSMSDCTEHVSHIF